ncbi:hypothetical protein QCD60_23430 [Pokkaliibacter sp. MBI-7]|uniref:hypothetical protein n=1 Tax=Pokkaliibacter sp. MBI-7 TaxID=3040600 RepID=UPI002448BF32|nr:hypothetical protein [Pokkaliibacter sp. MBI-7]MDH2435481.1 hypothetical protein [Pokkaliibacter sp. MBI-7]
MTDRIDDARLRLGRETFASGTEQEIENQASLMSRFSKDINITTTTPGDDQPDNPAAEPA